MEPKIKVFLVDDHQVVREGMISLLQENERLHYSGEADNGKRALARIAELDPLPDVVLMDINMPVMDGIECTKTLKAQFGDKLKVLALTMVKQSLHIRRMLQAGASGYVLKTCDKMELFAAIESIYQGENYFSQAVSQEVMNELTKLKIARRSHAPIKLSKREQEVLQLIIKDLSNQQIANQLHISIRTVETHKRNLIAKTATNHVAGLVVYAIKHRLVDIA